MLNQGAPGRLLIAGMGNTEAVKAFADTAKDAAESITVQENILTDPVGIKALQNIDTAVLIADKKKQDSATPSPKSPSFSASANASPASY